MAARSEQANPDNLVLPFRVERADTSGRLVRLGDSLDEILSRHGYPDAVSEILGEALLLVALFGSTIKERKREKGDGNKEHGERFILQAQTDGPISLIVADYHSPGDLRGYVRFDEERLTEAMAAKAVQGELLGHGHLAMTIDRGGNQDRYQGIVALEAETLSAAADRYFAQSEQLPTWIKLSLARHFDAKNTSNNAENDGWRWRGGGLMVQKLTPVGGYHVDKDEQDENGDAKAAEPDTDDGWNRAHILATSVKDHELLDPLLTPEELLFRLFHEDGVRVFPATDITAGCNCSNERIAKMLAGFTRNERKDMVREDGHIHITCEFCNRTYRLLPDE